jgi:glycosyltransferase involved in cell wall biosynthesis
MRICYVCLGFPPSVELGGPIRNAYHLTKELVRRGHRVTVCCANLANKNTRLFAGSRRVEYEGIDVSYFNTHKLFPVGLRSFGVYVWPELFSFCRRELAGFDVVHLDGYRDFPTLVVSHYSRRFGIPYVLQARGTLRCAFTSLAAKWAYDMMLGRRILGGCALCIASSFHERADYAAMLKTEKPVHVIPNGIELADYGELPRGGLFRDRYGISEKTLITYVGRVHPIKGIDVLLSAFALAGCRPTARVAIIGPDEGHKADLAALARKLGILDSVSFVDSVDGREKLQVYVDSDVVVYAGASESFGMVAIEAMMCGVPVIVSEGTGCGELVDRFGGGTLIPYGDARRMAEAIDSIVTDPGEARKRSAKAGQTVRQELAWSAIAARYEEAYQTAAGSRPHR